MGLKTKLNVIWYRAVRFCLATTPSRALGLDLMAFGLGWEDQERLKTALAKTDGSFIKWLNRIKKAHLIILDDFGLQPISQQVKLALLQIIEDRYENASTNLLLSVTRVQMARILRRTNHRRRFTRQNHSESAPNRTQRK